MSTYFCLKLLDDLYFRAITILYIFLSGLLHIVSAEDSEKANILHRQLVTLFDEEHVLELILVLSQDMEARENAQYNLLIMEILHALVRDQVSQFFLDCKSLE